MNESQLKLKSILDRWSYCTITIGDAEKELMTWARDEHNKKPIRRERGPLQPVDLKLKGVEIRVPEGWLKSEAVQKDSGYSISRPSVVLGDWNDEIDKPTPEMIAAAKNRGTINGRQPLNYFTWLDSKEAIQ